MEPATLLRTVLVVHTCDAALCRVYAHKNGLNKNLWFAIGFVFGLWAVAAVTFKLVTDRRSLRRKPPTAL
jgi:hypothetical protein